MAELSRRNLVVGGVVTAAAAAIPATLVVEQSPACILTMDQFNRFLAAMEQYRLANGEEIARLLFDRATDRIRREPISLEEFYG